MDDDGFYHLEKKRFDEIETTIPIHKVADFVTQNRTWLNIQDGFHTHVRSLEYQLTYQLTPNNRLTFLKTLSKTKEEAKIQDFGSWVYLQGYGFYSKASSSFNFLLKPGMSLSAEQIPLFIRMNREELSLIPGFFNKVCPVTKAGLRVELTEKGRIRVSPHYELAPEISKKLGDQSIRFFDEVVYREGAGFYELPPQLHLPEKFLRPIELEGEDLNFFFTYELEEIRQYIVFIDPSLERPKELNLVTKSITQVPELGRGWYRFALSYRSEKGRFPLPLSHKLLKKRCALFVLKAV